MNLLANTSWAARPETDDYLNVISFGDKIGLAMYGDDQAIRWASYFRYVLEDGVLRMDFLPTANSVGRLNESEYTIQTEIHIGHVSYEAWSRGRVLDFAGTALTFAKPFHGCDEDSLIFFEQAFNGVVEEDRFLQDIRSDTVEVRSLRALKLLGLYGLAWIPFIQAGLFLARVPGADERAMLLFFMPPVAASVFVMADNGRFERTVVRAAWLLLSVTAVASLITELNFLPIKPQFPALPARVDRVMVLYLVGWYSYVMILCPGWFVYWRLVGNGRCHGRVSRGFVVGCLVWLGFVGTLLFLAMRKLF
jgi:hypothetical protein